MVGKWFISKSNSLKVVDDVGGGSCQFALEKMHEEMKLFSALDNTQLSGVPSKILLWC